MRSRNIHALGAVFILAMMTGETAQADKREAPAAETVESGELKKIRALWKKLGPHAPEGSKLAADNKMGFEAYYRSAAKQIRETKKADVPRNQNLDALMCLPCAYGWPQSRQFGKDTRYTGLVPVFETGDYELTMDAWPKAAKAKIVLEIDGEPIDEIVSPNRKVRVKLEAGVRAFTVHTDEDVKFQFLKLVVERVVNDRKAEAQE